MEIKLTVNGVTRSDEVEPRLLLIHYLRETLDLRAANIGCDTTSCGACTVLLDGESVKSCTVLAVQQDRAGTAGRGVAADVGRRQAGRVAQEMHQQRPVFDVGGHLAAVDRDGHLHWVPAFCASSMAVQTRSGVRGRSMCRILR